MNEGLFLWPNSDEDCLFPNIYTPTNNPNGLLPVMVWMHGGAFVVGSGKGYGPTYFVVHDIIIVTINYRLGPLGFLSLGTEYVPGNAGLFDQQMALEWVQQNIASFGGDPGQVPERVQHIYLPQLILKGHFGRTVGRKLFSHLSPVLARECRALPESNWTKWCWWVLPSIPLLLRRAGRKVGTSRARTSRG